MQDELLKQHLINSTDDLVDLILLNTSFDYDTETLRLNNEEDIKAQILIGLLDIRNKQF